MRIGNPHDVHTFYREALSVIGSCYGSFICVSFIAKLTHRYSRKSKKGVDEDMHG